MHEGKFTLGRGGEETNRNNDWGMNVFLVSKSMVVKASLGASII